MLERLQHLPSRVRAGALCAAVCLGPGAVAAPAQAQPSDDPRCRALFNKGARRLAAQQYLLMLRVARDRRLLCPDIRGAYLLGLAQANLVDKGIVNDPAERELMRRKALKNLRIAAAGETADLRPEWALALHQWIVSLEELAPRNVAVPIDDEEREEGPELPDVVAEVQNTAAPRPRAPGPPPQPHFPAGPVLLGGLGAAAVITALVTGIEAASIQTQADDTAAALQQSAAQLSAEQAQQWVRRITEASDEADTLRTWSTGLWIAGGAALATGLGWYFLMPPEGKWRWAVAPPGVSAAVRF